MSPFEWLLASAGSVTLIFIVLLIYRSTLLMHEDDQLFLDDSEAHMAKDQMELMSRLNKLTPIMWVAGTLAGIMLLVVAGLFVYQGLTTS